MPPTCTITPMSRKRRPGMFPAMKPVLTLAVLMMPGWFGHNCYWTPIVHKDDHRFLLSSPRIRLGYMVALRNFLMCRAAERTAQLVHNFALVTGCRKEGPGP